MGKGKVCLKNSKKQWLHEKVGKASDRINNKVYAELKQNELNENDEKSGNVFW